MLKRCLTLLIIAVTSSFFAPLSTAINTEPTVDAAEFSSTRSAVPAARLARLRHGINLSHWFAQSADYSRVHLESHTTAEDIALIRKIGFDHVRLTLEPAPLFNPQDPAKLNAEYLKYLDSALDLILAQGLAVIVDIHPSDEFKVRLNSNDRQLEAFGRFWRALAQHLSTRDPERVFLEVLNEPMVQDGYRWFGMQGKLISAIRSGAPQHTIVASGHRWSGISELLFLQPYADRNIIYNFHFYDPHTWKLIKSVAIPWAGADHLDFSADGRYLMVTTEFTGMLARVDTQTMELAGAVHLGGLPVDVKLSPDGSVFYVTNQDPNHSGVSVVDPVEMAEVDFIPTESGAHGLYISRDATKLYVSNRLAGSISVIDMATREVVATWHTGGSPDMIQISPDGRQLWVSGRFDSTVYVVDTATGDVIHRIKVGAGDHGLCYFPEPGRFSLGHNGVYR